MGAVHGQVPFTDQERIDHLVSATESQSEFHADGSGKANDFHPSGLPRSHWPPGLRADGHISVHRETLTRVGAHMSADMTALRGALSALNGGGAGGATLGGWATADGMGINSGQAYYGITTFCQRLVDDLDETIGHLRQTFTNYADAELTTATAANKVGTGTA